MTMSKPNSCSCKTSFSQAAAACTAAMSSWDFPTAVLEPDWAEAGIHGKDSGMERRLSKCTTSGADCSTVAGVRKSGIEGFIVVYTCALQATS